MEIGSVNKILKDCVDNWDNWGSEVVVGKMNFFERGIKEIVFIDVGLVLKMWFLYYYRRIFEEF